MPAEAPPLISPNLPATPAPLGDIGGCARALAAGSETAVGLAKRSLERARALQPTLNFAIDLLEEQAMTAAQAADTRRRSGAVLSAVDGVPFAIKDNLVTAFGRTTCGSRLLEQYRSPFTATAVQRLLDAGAVPVLKANLDEFAMGGSGENSAFGATRNPWDPSRVPGGSSSGSAAAVAAGVVPFALGSDTGGSIRQPAGLCGVCGIKPTYGRVSRSGLVAYASSLDQVGPLAHTPEDLRLVLSLIAGHDPADSTSARANASDLLTELEPALPPGTKVRIGIPPQARATANAPAVLAAMQRAERSLRAAGVELVDVDLPHADHAIAAYYIIATAEASSNLARFDGVRYGQRAKLGAGEGLHELYVRSRTEGFGAEVQRRIMLGTHVLSSGYYDAYYLTALKARRLIKGDYDRAFAEAGVSAVLMPSSPGPAFAIGEKSGDPLAMYLEDVYTVGVNLAGLPAVTVPGGFQPAGGTTPDLPVGLQLIGPPHSEATLLRLATLVRYR